MITRCLNCHLSEEGAAPRSSPGCAREAIWFSSEHTSGPFQIAWRWERCSDAWLQKVPALEAQPPFRSEAVGRDMPFSLVRDRILPGDTSSCQGAPRGSHPARAWREPRLSSSASWHSCSLCVYEGPQLLPYLGRGTYEWGQCMCCS